MTLPARMRAAAETLIEVSRLYQAFDPTRFQWCADDLLREAGEVEVGDD